MLNHKLELQAVLDIEKIDVFSETHFIKASFDMPKVLNNAML